MVTDIPFPDAGDLDSSTGTGLCDFCSPPGHGVWGYPCKSHYQPDPNGVFEATFDRVPASHGDWAACETCADLIERNHRDKLARRVPKYLQANGHQRQVIELFFINRKPQPRYWLDPEPYVVYDEPVITPTQGDPFAEET